MNVLRNACSTVLAVIALSSAQMSCAFAQEHTAALNTPLQTGGAAASPDPNAAPDKWHISFVPYLWFAGVHGTTGIRGINASLHASAGDLLSHFNFGLMGTLEARRNRFVLPVDMMWMRLSDDKSLPVNQVGLTSIDARVGQFILTPKAGYQIVDTPKLKVDGLAGLRYWHLGEELNLNPRIANGVSTSQNWVDGIGGARIEMPVSPKASIAIGGDAGAGGSDLEYQVFGALGYKITKKITLLGGWRYLDVDYNSSGFLYNVTLSGVAFGATFQFR